MTGMARASTCDFGHGSCQAAHFALHTVDLRFHVLDGLGGADEFVVVFVDEHLHVTVKLFDFRRQFIAALHQLWQRFGLEHLRSIYRVEL